MSRICIVQGHPDPAGGHFDHALAEAYRAGAEGAGHEVRIIEVASLDFPLLRSATQWKEGEVPPGLVEAQQAIAWAEHLVIVYPLWLGTMPALLKAFLEQVLRPGFAIGQGGHGMWKKLLAGRSARVVVTMGMPAFAYRWWFGAHSVRSLERNILKFVGFSPVRSSLIGMVESPAKKGRERWLVRMREFGARGS
ncbi:MAG: NAD(P)H-dependent oxidoreductase [Azoarcus sp.]|nr:NAD(P)H-dependent oxidoreductase [Azoarcus sp.]